MFLLRYKNECAKIQIGRKEVYFMAVKDMEGKRFGRLTVLYRMENDKHRNAVWMCRCDCGVEKPIVGNALRKGVVVSCGCYHRDRVTEMFTTHGMSKTRIRNIWNHVKQRCINPNNDAYKYYGGRGICICEEWKSFPAFLEWSMNNGYDEDLTIDRIDTNGNYEPNNCRLVSRKVQQNNTRHTRLYTINGETKSIAEWCRKYGVPHERVRVRVVDKGWDIEKALTTPKLNGHGLPVE